MAMILTESRMLHGVVTLLGGVVVKAQRGFAGEAAGYLPTNPLFMRHPQPCWSSGDSKPEQRPHLRDALGAGRSLSRAGVSSSTKR